jgi:hypothetical protein
MDVDVYPLDPTAETPARRWCALCGLHAVAARRQDSRCSRCGSPLAPPLDAGDSAASGRRAAVRRDRRHAALLQVGWPAPLEPIRWCDLSLSGLSFLGNAPIAPGTAVRVFDEALEAVAEVVACERDDNLYRVHARLLTVLFLRSRGVFVSASA